MGKDSDPLDSDIDTLVTDFNPLVDLDGQLTAVVTILAGPGTGQAFPMTSAEMIIGRDPAANISIPDPSLSRKHARIHRTSTATYLQDLGSTNGTMLNHKPIDGAVVLKDGDRIVIGTESVLSYSVQDEMEQKAALESYELTVRDALTQVFNRRHLDERLTSEFAYALRHGEALSLLVIDIDHFKLVNDTHGHPAGDEVLRKLGVAMLKTVRAEDIVARYGGEEFVVVARGIDTTSAMAFAERMRVEVEAMRIVRDGVEIRVTISIGVANTETTPHKGSQGLFAAADGALYEAKRAGRNRVVLARETKVKRRLRRRAVTREIDK